MSKLQHKMILVAIFLMGFCGGAFAQIQHGGTPYSFKQKNFEVFATVLLPAMDNQRLLQEEIKVARKEEGYQFGKEIAVDYRLDNSGTWEELPDGGRLWRLGLQSKGAYSINLLFDNFYIPPASNLFIYTADRSFVLGSFTAENNNKWGNFATTLLPGDAIVLELYEAAQDRNNATIQLSTIVHGYKNFLFQNKGKEKGTYGNSSWCNVNVNCEIGQPSHDVKRAVALIINETHAHCSGTLINNTKRDCTPYFLTAWHCVTGKYDTKDKSLSQFVFVFNYETTDCEGTNSAKTYSINGATIVAMDDFSDFALLLLDDKPPMECNPYFAGWNRKDTSYTGVFGIHHPKCDWKMISIDRKTTASGKFHEERPEYPDHTHHIVVWDTGTTENGSSGSGLFNRDKLLIGQLHGGYAECGKRDSADCYGKISYSWTNNNSPDSNRLDYWLDPICSGVEFLTGMEMDCSVNIKKHSMQEDIITVYPNPVNYEL